PVPGVHLQDRLEFSAATIDAALHEGHGDSPPVLRQLGQYQGAGVLIGFGLLLRHLAHRKRLPLTAVFGRTFFPVLRMLFAIGASLHAFYQNGGLLLVVDEEQRAHSARLFRTLLANPFHNFRVSPSWTPPRSTSSLPASAQG